MEESFAEVSVWFENFLWIALFIMSISALLAAYRVVIGPSRADRVISLDTIGINIVGITAILSIQLHTVYLMDVMLVIGILTFLGTVAVAKFIEKGVVFERNRN